MKVFFEDAESFFQLTWRRRILMLLIPIAAKDSDFEAINVTSFSNCWLQIMLFFKRFADLMDMLILFRWYALFCKYSRSLQSFRRYGVARKWCPYSLIIMPDDWEYYHHIIQNYTLCYSLSRSFSWPLIYQEQGLGLIFLQTTFPSTIKVKTWHFPNNDGSDVTATVGSPWFLTNNTT